MARPIYSPMEVESFVKGTKAERFPTKFEILSRWAGNKYPFLKISPSQTLADSVRAGGMKVDGEDVMALASFFFITVTGLIYGTIALTHTFFGLGLTSLLAFLFFGWLPGAVAYGVITSYPNSVKCKKLQQNFGGVTSNMLILCSSYKFRSQAEGAIADVARYGEGKMAQDCKEGLRDTMWATRYSSIREFLTDYAHEWSGVSEPVKRALLDVRRAIAEPNRAKASADLDKAMDRVLKWVKRNFSRYIDSVKSKASYLTLFVATGIVMLAAMIPIFRIIGWGFNDLKFSAIILGGLVGASFMATEGVLKGRPPAFAGPNISRHDPRVPPSGKSTINDHTVPILPFVILAPILMGLPTFLYFAGIAQILPDLFIILPLFWGLAAGIWIYSYLYSRPRLKVMKEDEELMHDMPTMLHTLGGKLDEGHPQEAALKETADLMEGSSVEKILRSSLSNILSAARTLHEALFSRTEGALRHVKNKLVRSILEMYARISTWSPQEGSKFAAGTAEFLAALDEARSDLREKFVGTYDNLRVVSCILVPLVTGVSLLGVKILSGHLMSQESGSLLGASFAAFEPISAQGLNVLALLLSLVCLALFLIFIRFGSYIKSGGSRVEFAKDIMENLPLATIVFSLALFGVQILGG